MTVVTDVLKELYSMFAGDARLTLAILVLVAIVAALRLWVPGADPLVAGFVLLAGCLAIVIAVTALKAYALRKGNR